MLIGLLTVKPQLGILFPFLLVASGRWKVFFTAASTAIALLLASIAIGGIEGWQDYITKALPLQREVLQDAAGTAMPFQPSIFMNIRGVVGNHTGEIIQFAFTLAAVAAVSLAFRSRRNADPRMLQALFFACTVSASPYMGAYDLLPLTFAAVALIAEEKLDGLGRRLAQLVYWTPALQLLFGNLQLPGPGFIAPAFAAYLLHRLFRPAPSLAVRPDHSSVSTSRSAGNSFIQSSATAIVATPPSTAAGTVPNSAAVTPLSNWPSWFEALMKRKFTAPTRPRISSGVASCTSENRITTLTVSAAPSTASASSDSHIQCDSENTTVAAPNTITAWNIRNPTRRLMVWRASSAVISSAPTAGAARSTPSPNGPVCRMSRA